MSARRTHPTLDAWLTWIEGGESGRELTEHLATCASCRALIGALRSARSARARGAWQEPSDEVLGRALGATKEKRLANVKRTRPMQWQASDVRGDGGSAVADDARIVAGSCTGGEISVLVHPPLRDASWRFEARVWLTEAPADARAVIGLVHGDHVLQRHEARDGEMVRFEEIVAEGWTLEIHLPGGETVLLGDPFHGE